MIERFKSNAEAIAAADKYLYGNHARMPIVMDKARAAGSGIWTATSIWTSWAASPSTAWATHHPAIVKLWTAPRI